MSAPPSNMPASKDLSIPPIFSEPAGLSKGSSKDLSIPTIFSEPTDAFIPGSMDVADKKKPISVGKGLHSNKYYYNKYLKYKNKYLSLKSLNNM